MSERSTYAILLSLVALASCAPPAMDGGFDSPNPSAQMYATEQAARAGDRSAIGRIVETLDSDDPAMRMLAIESLRRLTGQTLGYRHSDPPAERREAIERWVKAVESGAVPATGETADGGGETDG